jgi:hypothetical protein
MQASRRQFRSLLGTAGQAAFRMKQTIKASDQLWKIITFIRSITPPGTNPPDKILPKE